MPEKRERFAERAWDLLPLGDLLQVIPIARTQLRDDTAVTVISLESYAHGFIIHTRAVYLAGQPLAAKGTSEPSQPLALDVTDDRGNHYDGGLLAAWDDSRAWYFSYRYGPALDLQARTLDVRVTVSGARVRGHEVVHAGPSTFTIPLDPAPDDGATPTQPR